jgi:hypothetical protein
VDNQKEDSDQIGIAKTKLINLAKKKTQIVNF